MSNTELDLENYPRKSQKSPALKGDIRAPGDKSISHRSLIFGAMATGTTHISGLLEGTDIISTADAVSAFGATVTKKGDGDWSVTGTGAKGWRTPKDVVDCGNAGTGVRLIMGAAAGYKLEAEFTGDASLSSRPMGRVLIPLKEMGANTQATSGDKLPIKLQSTGQLSAIDYTPPQASAQVKSCILLAGLNTQGKTIIREPHLTRDHTENMLEAFGVTLIRKPVDQGQIVELEGPATLNATTIMVPGDPSSAAFPIVAALITPGSDIIIRNVMMNPTRTGLFETLIEMGAYLRTDNFKKSGGEIIADIHVRHSQLRGVTVPPKRAASMIDEYPILAVAAAFATGDTVMDGIGELRVKESDRIAATAALLCANGVKLSEHADGLTVKGAAQAGTPVKGGGHITTHHDHRIAMSALILGLNAKAPVTIDDASMIATSFPSFFDLMASLGANFT